ncbi:uncharacterized protein LOC110739098 [Chenopodium quinoa]|uniref:uncharacterized protein LOC110739098 n=1 Tax=Chenopodium quinoa TaxID=63459 RepID=UPI000B77EE40|nr:uncharacterized protein LOC110739098 [Chenopodium quinoa]
MNDEFSALIKTGTWDLVPWPTEVNIVNCMWLFKHKFKSNGDLERHKARLMCDGKSQEVGVDCDETFSAVVKPATICIVLSLALAKKWSIHQLDVKNAFLHRIAVTRTPSYLLLSQEKYAQEILERAGLGSCKPAATPVDTKSKLSADAGPPFRDPTLLDIAYAVQQVCLFMHDPRESHYDALKRILRYVQDTINHGLHLYPSTSHRLITYTDGDWGGCPDTRRSTSGYCCFLGDNLVSWSSKRQHTLSKSSAEAEYRGVANVVSEACWLRNLLLELHCPLRQATIVYCDNVSAIYLSGNSVQHQRTKHVEMDIHFVRENVSLGQAQLLHVPSRYQFADIFTKGLPRDLFLGFRSSLSVRPPPAMTAGL